MAALVLTAPVPSRFRSFLALVARGDFRFRLFGCYLLSLVSSLLVAPAVPVSGVSLFLYLFFLSCLSSFLVSSGGRRSRVVSGPSLLFVVPCPGAEC